MLKIKLLTLLLFINLCYACKLDFSKIDTNLDSVLKHIKEIEIDSFKSIHGFHYYKPKEIEKHSKVEDLKICKINDNLWVLTKGNPWKFHSGIILYIYQNEQIIGFKNFFPCAWGENTLNKEINELVFKIKCKKFNSMYKKKIKDRFTWVINAQLKEHVITIIINYYIIGSFVVQSIYPSEKHANDINIDSSVVFEIMEQQIKNANTN